MLGTFEVHPQVVRAAHLHRPVRHFAVPVVIAVLPCLLLTYHDDPVFGDDVAARYQLHLAEGGCPVHGDDISQLDERVPPVVRVQCQVHEGLEPGRLEYGRQFRVLHPLSIHDAETLVQHIPFALSHASGEVHVHLHVAIHVIQRHTVGIFHILCILPGVAPGAHVFLGKRLGLQLQVDGQSGHPLHLGGIAEVYSANPYRVLFLVIAIGHSLLIENE